MEIKNKLGKPKNWWELWKKRLMNLKQINRNYTIRNEKVKKGGSRRKMSPRDLYNNITGSNVKNKNSKRIGER